MRAVLDAKRTRRFPAESENFGFEPSDVLIYAGVSAANLHRYVNNDPVNEVDPSGLQGQGILDNPSASSPSPSPTVDVQPLQEPPDNTFQGLTTLSTGGLLSPVNFTSPEAAAGLWSDPTQFMQTNTGYLGPLPATAAAAIPGWMNQGNHALTFGDGTVLNVNNLSIKSDTASADLTLAQTVLNTPQFGRVDSIFSFSGSEGLQGQSPAGTVGLGFNVTKGNVQAGANWFWSSVENPNNRVLLIGVQVTR